MCACDSYAIGVAEPLSVFVDSYGTATDGRTDKDLLEIVQKNFDLRPGPIIKQLALRRPIYTATARYVCNMRLIHCMLCVVCREGLCLSVRDHTCRRRY